MAGSRSKQSFIEIVRLFVVIACTAGGYQIGRAEPGWLPDTLLVSGSSVLVATVLGAAVGYVLGGAVGRSLHVVFSDVEDRAERAPVADVLVGSLGAAVGLLVGVVVAAPVALLTRPLVWVPTMVFTSWLLATLSYRIARDKRDELLALGGLSPKLGDWPCPRCEGILLDTSAVIDGRILGIVRAGFLAGPLLIPRFVLEEVQAIADASDTSRRRRGRRGLEILDVLKSEVGLETLDEELPEIDAVDAKLVRLADRRGVPLLTTDYNLQKVAELQGIAVMNVHRLVDAVRPHVVAGDNVRVRIEAEGRDERQGVGYMDDGTMVVVSDASGAVGEIVEAIITSAHRTSVGRMLFARRKVLAGGVEQESETADT